MLHDDAVEAFEQPYWKWMSCRNDLRASQDESCQTQSEQHEAIRFRHRAG